MDRELRGVHRAEEGWEDKSENSVAVFPVLSIRGPQLTTCKARFLRQLCWTVAEEEEGARVCTGD